MKKSADSLIPEEVYRHLIRAAVLPREEALKAFDIWSGMVPIENADHVAIRLLPMVHRNLASAGIDVAPMKKTRGVHRMEWYKNQLMLTRAADILGLLREAEIPLLPLKGLALCIEHYADPGTRPMGDLDLLVPPERALEALELLLDDGWHTKFHLPVRMRNDAMLRCRHAVPLTDDNGNDLDLHWYPHPFMINHYRVSEFWRDTRTIEWADMPLELPATAVQLLLVLVHGMSWNPVPTLRMYTDAFTLITRGKPDWDTFFDLAQDLNLGYRIARALKAFDTVLPGILPVGLLEKADSVPVEPYERREYRLFARSFTPGRRLLLSYARMGRRRAVLNHRRNPALTARVPSFMTFMKHYSQRSSLLNTIVSGLKGIIKHAGGRGMESSRRRG